MYLTVEKPAKTLVEGVWKDDYPNTQRVGAVAIDVWKEGVPDTIRLSICMCSKSDQFETQLARNRAVGRLDSADYCLVQDRGINLKDCVKHLGLEDPDKHRNYFYDIDWDQMQYKFQTAIKIMLERKGLIPVAEMNHN